uniref:Peroxiredoxin-6 n=1 Tax=Salmo trutta TaxID=8032 RepID=A0A674AYW5_SALTR
MPGLLLGDVFPNFEAETTKGKIKFHDFLGDSWGILFSHPSDYTPVCTTELGRAAKLSDEFSRRDVKMIALSIDSLEDHHGWTKDILAYNNEESGCAFPFPIIADNQRELAVALGMLDPNEKDKDGMPLTARCVFVIGQDKKLKLSLLYPATTGRNFDEILRVVDSLQLTAKNRVATPADWQVSQPIPVKLYNLTVEFAASFRKYYQSNINGSLSDPIDNQLTSSFITQLVLLFSKYLESIVSPISIGMPLMPISIFSANSPSHSLSLSSLASA